MVGDAIPVGLELANVNTPLKTLTSLNKEARLLKFHIS